MKTIFLFEDLYQEYERTHSEIETLENFYQNYDSHVIQEDLNFSGLRAFSIKTSQVPAGLRLIIMMIRVLLLL